jgi:uncharacterized protein (TIGR03435 family)
MGLLIAVGGGGGWAQTAAAGNSPAFEVSAVRVNRTGSNRSESDYSNGRYTATNITVKNVMEYSAFGLPAARIVDGPKWIDNERFDIQAKVDGPTAASLEKMGHAQREELLHILVQQLLADRFHLRTHWETREMPVYVLVPAKKGAKLQKAAKADEGADTSESDGRLDANHITLDGLAQTLTQELAYELGRVVLNRTGIPGRYDVRLRWTPQAQTAAAAADAPPEIFTAMEEQLGLKLEPSKGPVEVLVIDSADEPTEN